MKLFQTTPKKTIAPDVVSNMDVQGAPIKLNGLNPGDSVQVKVDLVCQVEDSLIVAGWRTEPISIGLGIAGKNVDVQELVVSRPDVNTHFALPADKACGFLLVADLSASKQENAIVTLNWLDGKGTTQSSAPLVRSLSADQIASAREMLQPAYALLLSKMEVNSPAWKRLISDCPSVTSSCRVAKGFLEGAAACEQTKDAVVVGWSVHPASVPVWLEDQTGEVYSLAGSFRRFRQDVHDAVGQEFGHGSSDSGFVLHINGLKPGATLKLKTLSESGIHTLSETSCSSLPAEPVGAARWLFAVGTPLSELHRRIPLVDEPVLAPLIKFRQSIWDELPVQKRVLGQGPTNPTVSIIIPLYGRTDFVEHQLIEFVKDDWLQQNAEIIYVLDDPKIVESFSAQAETLHRLYRLPFTWVWGSVNRGFSGANNLGTQHARGDYFVFLNSDAFPQHAGWIESLIDPLAQRPDIGAVGPKLVFADGGIQHAGMEFQRRDELGIWVNHHPHMGLDPSLDPHRELTELPAITGACLAMRRSDFERLGGWDTGYLIGDFEDSDLCLKLRSNGLSVAYLPDVQLTHLERQSFKLLGQDEFRTRVVIYNAVRHQNRWSAIIDQPTHSV